MKLSFIGLYKNKTIYNVCDISYYSMLQVSKKLRMHYYEVGNIVAKLKTKLAEESYLCDDYGATGNWRAYLDDTGDAFINHSNARILDDIRVGKPCNQYNLPLAIKTNFHIAVNDKKYSYETLKEALNEAGIVLQVN